MAYEIGEIYPIAARRAPLGKPSPEAWYIMTTRPQAEIKAMAWLQSIGAVETWRPTEQVWQPTPREKAAGKNVERAIAQGYIWAKLDRALVWDVMKEQANGKLSDIIRHGPQRDPYRIPHRVMMAMRQVPETLAAMQDDKAAQAEAQRQATLPMVGRLAMVTAGPLGGNTALVMDIRGGIASCLFGAATVRVDVGNLVRVK